MTGNKALTIVEPGVIKVIDSEIPEIKADEVLVNVHYVAICGSDVKLYKGAYTGPHKYPIIMGHEWFGTIVKTGAESGKSVGKNVVGDCSVFCGECYYCNFNKNHCVDIKKRGINLDGGAANYIAVKSMHVTECIDVENEKLLTLTEPMSVAVNGIMNRIPASLVERTRRALVLGAGGIGMMSMFTLLEYEIPEIVVVDISQEKVELINKFGIESVTAICTDAKGLLKQKTELFDLIVEATGTEEAMKNTIDLSNPCAHIVCVGHQKKMEFDFGMLVQKSLTIHGSNGSTGGFSKSMKIIEKNSQYVEQMITDIVPLSKAVKYFEEKLFNKNNIKVLINLDE